MRILRTRDELAALARAHTAFVPTMGNLHAGHLALVSAAQALAERVVVSIFINPLQFGAGEDYETYPRTFDADVAALESAGVDVVFAPAVESMYPDGSATATRIIVPPELGSVLEGAHRPGHFDGVATVVARLFELVRPDEALFGEKDYQQLLVIRWLVESLDLPIDIHGCPTVREADGLAMSSRNQYLTEHERALAPILQQTLSSCAAAMREGDADMAALERSGLATLAAAGFVPDYFTIRDVATLAEPQVDAARIVLAAARLGRARLIDNLREGSVEPGRDAQVILPVWN